MHKQVNAAASQRANVRLFRVADIESSDRAAWAELVRGAAEPNPFFEPGFVIPLSKARPKDDVHLLVVDDAGRWTACVPVVKRWKWRRIPVPVLATWMSQYTFLGTPLVVRDGVAPLLQLVAGAHSHRWGGLALEWVGADGPVAAMLREALSRYGGPTLQWERFQRATLRRRPGSPAVDVHGKTGTEFRRKRRALERECGGELLLVNRADDPAAVEEFIALETTGWKGEEGTAIGSKEVDCEFFRQTCREFAREGRLHLLALQGSRTVAMQCSFVSGDVIFGFRTCFDESFGRHSPGAQIMLDTLAAFNEGDVGLFDSCTDPNNSLCNRLMRDRRSVETLFVAPPTVFGTSLTAMMSAASSVRRLRRRVMGIAMLPGAAPAAASAFIG